MIIGFILTRLLVIAALVFIFGYIFGNFSAKKSLTTLTRISAVLLLVFVIVANIFAFRFGPWRGGHDRHHHENCSYQGSDSTEIKR